jgi:hypothetical protein
LLAGSHTGIFEHLNATCANVDWTKAAIGVLYDALEPGGVVMVDDVKFGTAYDGAAAAYFEFCRERAIAPDVRADRAGMLIKAP